MTYQELQERCKGRNFDQIIVAVEDIFQKMAEMQRILHVVPGDVRVCTHETDPGLKADGREISYIERQATFFYQNTEVCLVQPVDGETAYKKYLERFGEGICCIRERISPQAFAGMEERLQGKGWKVSQRMESAFCRAAWVDLTEELGFLFEVISDDSKKVTPSFRIPERIAQINITTPDVRKTVEAIVEYLEIGPWEVGRQCNATAHDYGFMVEGKLEDVEFEFLLGILVCGNIEWEAIQPVKGPLVYKDFLQRHGIGFHHILQEIPQKDWKERQDDFKRNGIPMTSKGSIGPVDWCYMDTEKELGFYTEMRTDAVMEQLPEGYLAYFYPEQD